ncbi:MAG: hypothetical protein RQ966_17330 [Acetobacteraceae bacterium]|nr:hypothetical protein [Acetobacteraceae bacterium]
MTHKLFLAALLTAPLAAYAQAPRQPSGAAPADRYNGVPPTSAYEGGAGSPFSRNASNIDRADTNSEIAPRLPSPDANGDDPRAFLQAAARALRNNQTGAAQEALERAETRVLTRSTDPALANRPDTQMMARGISDAREALGHRDPSRARAIVEHILNAS